MPAISTQQNNFVAVRKTLLWVLLANLSVTIIKITLGLLTGALAVVADGFHSLVDTSSNLIGLAAIRLANRPADEKHPYGYARYETLGSLAIGGLLLVAAYEIGAAVVERFTGGGAPSLDLLTFGLIAFTFPVNLTIVILESRAGKKLNSQILISDATHTKTDLFITGSVVTSLIGVWLGWTWLDLVVASAVVVLILRAAFTILRNTSISLADATILDTDPIERLVMEVPGVWYVHRIRSRGAPASVFVDLHVKVYPGMSTDQAHSIATEVETRIKNSFPQVVDVLVHIEPGKIDPAQLRGYSQNEMEYQQISYDLRQIADGLGLGVHDLHVQQDVNGELDVEAHLELNGDTTLDVAHDLAESYERRVRAQWPNLTNIITHLEPLLEKVRTTDTGENPELIQDVFRYLSNRFAAEQIVEVHSHHLEGHDSVAIRLMFPGSMSLEEAHNIAEEIERDLINNINGVYRVIVHVEPLPLKQTEIE